jgi:hypothetical protein
LNEGITSNSINVLVLGDKEVWYGF